jgi:hypothetical protein
MRRGPKVLLSLIPGAGPGAIRRVCGNDVIASQPRVPDIRRLLAAAAAEEKSPPDSIRRVLRTSYPIASARMWRGFAAGAQCRTKRRRYAPLALFVRPKAA